VSVVDEETDELHHARHSFPSCPVCMYMYSNTACIIMRDKQIRDGVLTAQRPKRPCLASKSPCAYTRAMQVIDNPAPSSRFPAGKRTETWPVVPCMNQTPPPLSRPPQLPSSSTCPSRSLPCRGTAGRRDGGEDGSMLGSTDVSCFKRATGSPAQD
jgi:hypothetical protein